MPETRRKKLKLAMVAGEESGDILGSDFLREIKRRFDDVEAIGIGGSRMIDQGFKTLYNMEKLSVRGYVEVFRHLPELITIRRELKNKIIKYDPDMFIGIDAPDFNLDLEYSLKRKNIKTVQYVSPSVWAWRQGRLSKIKKSIDKMLTLFPFEKELYESWGIPVAFVGHPLADSLRPGSMGDQLRKDLDVAPGTVVVSLLPGSRQSEVRQMASLMVETAREVKKRIPEVLFLVPLISNKTIAIFRNALHLSGQQSPAFKIMYGHSTQAIAASDAALIASGTATLEAALLGVPMIITYKMPKISEWIMKLKKTDLPWVGLPNILSDSFVVPEILLKDANPRNLSQALCNLLADELLQHRIKIRFENIRQVLKKDASSRAVDAVLPILEQEKCNPI